MVQFDVASVALNNTTLRKFYKKNINDQSSVRSRTPTQHVRESKLQHEVALTDNGKQKSENLLIILQSPPNPIDRI